MPKRPRYSRWRRLPEVFRTGEHKFAETKPETQRLTLQLSAKAFQAAEALVAKLEKPSVQEYCAELLANAIENQRLLHHVEEFESKHGALEGLAEIAQDPDYLAEWEAQSRVREGSADGEGEPPRPTRASPEHYVSFHSDNLSKDEESAAGIEPLVPEIEDIGPSPYEELEKSADPSTITWSVEPIVRSIREKHMESSTQATSAEVIHRHAGLSRPDYWSFLPCLRRGEAAPAGAVDELVDALRRFSNELADSSTLDRATAHALHRLALESQVLLTEAWPGAFDENTVLAIRAVQAGVENIFTCQSTPAVLDEAS